MTQYTTITSKGQLTIPVSFRQELGLKPGRKIAVSLTAGVITIREQTALDTLRPQLHEQMQKKGTLETSAESGAGFTAHVKEKYAG
ncbi:MAG: AbrB/MazE/SpoVT family DNA-binding domain-containing protein [Coriobacteriia bacterium]|nr:AbrB/MazE/SpoVT family DNA-binding domain-containing protein [Coriobacteriia bacterium]